MIGGCDLYTTKAAGTDKKLYKNIEHSLESQYESLLRLSASLSPPNGSVGDSSLNLSRSSPFGSLSQISSRRTFAYLIATLNASHPDYDFSHLLRPTDFRREKSLRSVIDTLDTTLYNLRPRPKANSLMVPSHWSSTITTSTPSGGQGWGPRMWGLIDKEMTLKECSIYCYSPEEDPYDGEDGAIWSFNYFFFNKARKRVCYIHFRGLSILSHSPAQHTPLPIKRSAEEDDREARSTGAIKRARYWLGDRAPGEVSGGWGEDDDEVIGSWHDDEVDVDGVIDDGDELVDEFIDDDVTLTREISKSAVRNMSEDVVESMEV